MYDTIRIISILYVKEESAMSNIEMENYVKSLSPELQEKARACKSNTELIRFAAENDLEIPTEILEGVAGGGCGSSKKNVEVCNKCGTTLTEVPAGLPKPSGKSKYCTNCKKVLISTDWHIEKR